MALLLGLIIPLFSFALQSYPRLFNRFFGVDMWTRLLEIQHVKLAGHKIPGRINRGFLIPGYFDYPIVFPWIFSFFDKKTLLRIQGFVSPFFDVLQNFVVFMIAYFITGNMMISVVAQLIYALTPILPVENSYMTPRSFGYLVFTLAFFPLFYFHIEASTLFLVVGFIFTCLLFLVHRFALQSFLFISLFFTLYDLSLVYLSVLIFAFISVTTLTKGYYLRVAKGHLSNIYFWIINLDNRFAHQIYENRSKEKQDWVGKIYGLLSTFSPIFLFGMSIWTLSGIVYLVNIFYPFVNLPINEVYVRLAIWVTFFYVFGAVVLKSKWLMPIGEGQRYLEMATVPSSILSSVIFISFFNEIGFVSLIAFLLILIANISLILFIQVKGIIVDKNRSLTNSLKSVFEYINNIPGKPRIMCIPHQITTMTVYNTKADVLVNADNPGLLELSDFYPVLKMPISHLKKKYRLEYVLLRESYAKKEDIKLEGRKEEFRKGDVVLIKL